jgi:hypothetical protein
VTRKPDQTKPRLFQNLVNINDDFHIPAKPKANDIT